MVRLSNARAAHEKPSHKVGKRPTGLKYTTDVEERRKKLEDDKWTAVVKQRLVKCGGCRRWVSLDPRKKAAYYADRWNKHRGHCRQIKIMQGIVIQKQTRKRQGGAGASKTAYKDRSGKKDASSKATGATEAGTRTVDLQNNSAQMSLPNQSSEGKANDPIMHVPICHKVFDWGVDIDWHAPRMQGGHGRRLPTQSPATTNVSLTAGDKQQSEELMPMSLNGFSIDERYTRKGSMTHDCDVPEWRSMPYPCRDAGKSKKPRSGKNEKGAFQPGKRISSTGVPLYRFSTARELQTYFGGATIKSMARIKAPKSKQAGVQNGSCCLLD